MGNAFNLDQSKVLSFGKELNSFCKLVDGKVFHALETGDTVPDSWDPMKMDQNLMMVDLPNSSKEYNDVLAEFSKTLGRTPNIIKVGIFVYPQ